MSNTKQTSQQSEDGEVEEDESELVESNDQEEGDKEKKQFNKGSNEIATEKVIKEKKQLNKSSSVNGAGKQPPLKEKRKKKEWPSREEIAKNRYKFYNRSSIFTSKNLLVF